MRKKTLTLLVIFVLLLTACGKSKVIDGREYETVGLINILLNDDSYLQVKDQRIQYEVIWGNVIWGAILCETVIAPIYFFGFSMFQPVGKRQKEKTP